MFKLYTITTLIIIEEKIVNKIKKKKYGKLDPGRVPYHYKDRYRGTE